MSLKEVYIFIRIMYFSFVVSLIVIFELSFAVLFTDTRFIVHYKYHAQSQQGDPGSFSVA